MNHKNVLQDSLEVQFSSRIHNNFQT